MVLTWPLGQRPALASVLFIIMNLARQDQSLPLKVFSKELLDNLLA